MSTTLIRLYLYCMYCLQPCYVCTCMYTAYSPDTYVPACILPTALVVSAVMGTPVILPG
jgi:hypothetical protein